MEEEIWKEIEGFNGLYEVSTHGRVKSWNKKGTKRDHPIYLAPKYMTGRTQRIQIVLCQNNQRFYFLLHRLVAVHFIENPLNLPQIDHIDGNSMNNCVSNLRWVNGTQNNFNSKKRKDNSSGIKGVSFCQQKPSCPWTARWVENKKPKSKKFKTKEEAVEYRRKMVELHYSKEHYIEDR